MSDSDIFDVIKQIKCQNINYHRECSIPAFFKNMWALKRWCVTKVAHCFLNKQAVGLMISKTICTVESLSLL